jgi:membrane-associated phospholipid phosphatase
VIWVLGVAAPLIVGFSRLYRGMHFLTDVAWGLLLGVFCVVVAARAILYRREERGTRLRVAGGASSSRARLGEN